MSNTIENDRLTFHDKEQIMEVDFSNVLFDSAERVNRFYDLVDEKITSSGKDKWYFLVNYKNCRLSPEAWIPFSNRGKKVNIACSLGSARFAVSEETGKSILKQSEKEDFDPNLFTTRQAAFDHLVEMRVSADAATAEKLKKESGPTERTTDQATEQTQTISPYITSRISFIKELDILEVDFSDYVFDTIATVNEFYDAITARILETDRKWYFMVNYTGTKIYPDAWYQWAIRSRRLNTAKSRGTVRFNPYESARNDIIKRAEADESDPNLVATRDEALARIVLMRTQP